MAAFAYAGTTVQHRRGWRALVGRCGRARRYRVQILAAYLPAARSAAVANRPALGQCADLMAYRAGVPPGRPRHPDKDLERLCQEIEAAGWRLTRRNRYYSAYCPCGQHKRTIHLSPSDHSYAQNVRQWFRRQPCWPKGT